MTKTIEAVQLTKFYGEARGIEGVDLQVEESEIFGFIGPNGAGKTTTIRSLLDLIFPTSGEARIFGLDTHKSSKEIKESVGYLPSDDYFYKGMSARNLLFYSARIRRIDDTATRNRIGEMAERLDLNLDAKIKSLSRGNRRKVSIINALLPRAKLLILDEPTSGLDPLMQTRFFELLQKEQENGTTIFFSSHILSEVQRICNRVAIIKKGKIVRTADIEALAREHVKKITLEFKPGKFAGEMHIDGAERIESNGNTVRFLYKGEITDVLLYLATNKLHSQLQDLYIERSTLEEIFIGYYDGSEEEQRS